MKKEKQQLLLEYLISNPDLWARCSHIIKSEYWNPEFRDAVDFIHSYHTEYHSLPEPEKILAEGGITLELREMDKASMEYSADEIEDFCKSQAIIQAIHESSKLAGKAAKHNPNCLSEQMSSARPPQSPPAFETVPTAAAQLGRLFPNVPALLPSYGEASGL